MLQETVAAHARAHGFRWQRGTIAMVEAGRRRLSLEEYLFLPTVLKAAGLVNADFKSEDLIGLSHPATPRPSMGREDVVKAWRHWGGARDLDPAVSVAVALASATEAVRRAARALQRSPVDVAVVVHLRHDGRTFEQERDARVNARWFPGARMVESVERGEAVGDAHPAMSRKLQALRGHITRELIEELRTLIMARKKKKRGARDGAA